MVSYSWLFTYVDTLGLDSFISCKGSGVFQRSKKKGKSGTVVGVEDFFHFFVCFVSEIIFLPDSLMW